MQHWKSKITFSRWSSIYFQSVFVGKFENTLEMHGICGKSVKRPWEGDIQSLGDVIAEQ
jgi:hypothetical protein